jgi:hypothetical protein
MAGPELHDEEPDRRDRRHDGDGGVHHGVSPTLLHLSIVAPHEPATIARAA